MSSKLVLGAVTFSFMLFMLSSCAEAPQQEIDAAQAAVEAAGSAEADRYMVNEYNAVQDSLEVALALVEEQNSRFSMLRDYGQAKVKLGAVIEMANQAKEQAIARKDEIRLEVQTALAEVQATLKETQALFAHAPSGKEGRVALNAMQSELRAVEASLEEVSTLMNSGDYLTARDKVGVSMEKAQSINAELKGAMVKYAKLKRS